MRPNKKLTTAQFRNAAYTLYHDEGNIEVDFNARVSRSDEGGGAYVQAWVWVENNSAQTEEKKNRYW